MTRIHMNNLGELVGQQLDERDFAQLSPDDMSLQADDIISVLSTHMNELFEQQANTTENAVYWENLKPGLKQSLINTLKALQRKAQTELIRPDSNDIKTIFFQHAQTTPAQTPRHHARIQNQASNRAAALYGMAMLAGCFVVLSGAVVGSFLVCMIGFTVVMAALVACLIHYKGWQNVPQAEPALQSL
ncbi:hypothetical protein ACFORL_02100 [Legionella dresdenensis]|uniref:Uncharacterized protein n=1 Tax=Legionella dresdenensis TaxID=450200 RepID=A0ABV8CC58_9GAMM